jgi:hypothetical protein
MARRSKRSQRGYPEIHIGSWQEFVGQVTSGRFQNWAFRGQPGSGWPLESSLSRIFRTRRIHPNVWPEQEERIIRVFRRKGHLLLQHVPASESTFEWVALMQHHGAPTRLLDFTWSPYVAAFFALEPSEGESAVWAVNSRRLLRQEEAGIAPVNFAELAWTGPDGRPTVSVNPRLKEVFEHVYLQGTHPVVAIADPEMMNHRLVAQQGTFLIPGRLDRPIDQLLAAYEDDGPGLIAKLVLDERVRDVGMRELLNMNITSATLFPGLDGLARSMAYEIEFHWDVDPRTGQRY